MSDKPDSVGMDYLVTARRRFLTVYLPLGVFLFVLRPAITGAPLQVTLVGDVTEAEVI